MTDTSQPRVAAAPEGGLDPVERALAFAIEEATRAGRFDVVIELATQLDAQRKARAGNVVPFDPTRKRGGR